MPTAFVTGGSGFIGGQLIEELPEERRTRLRKGVEQRVALYFHDGESRFPAEARLILARSSGGPS